MKKLIAMLLALAIVASFGVTAAFAGVNYTNAESRDHYIDRLNFYNDAIASGEAKIASLTEVQELWNHYFTEKEELEKAGQSTAALDLEMRLALADLQAENAGIFYGDGTQADVASLYNFDAHKNEKSKAIFALADKILQPTKDMIAKAEAGIVKDDLYFNIALYGKLAEKDEAEAAAIAAAAARAALEEKLTKGIDQSTEAGKLLAAATIAKYDANEALTSAKKAADAAKKTIEVAKKGAYTSAQAAVLDAQAYAYNNLAAGITAEVNSYVDSVYDAIADFYASLYE